MRSSQAINKRFKLKKIHCISLSYVVKIRHEKGIQSPYFISCSLLYAISSQWTTFRSVLFYSDIK